VRIASNRTTSLTLEGFIFGGAGGRIPMRVPLPFPSSSFLILLPFLSAFAEITDVGFNVETDIGTNVDVNVGFQN
jgi:hypothetical protein